MKPIFLFSSGRRMNFRESIRFSLTEELSTVIFRRGSSGYETVWLRWRNVPWNLRIRETNRTTRRRVLSSVRESARQSRRIKVHDFFFSFLFHPAPLFYAATTSKNIFSVFHPARTREAFSRGRRLLMPPLRPSVVRVLYAWVASEWERCATHGLSLASLAVPISQS